MVDNQLLFLKWHEYILIEEVYFSKSDSRLNTDALQYYITYLKQWILIICLDFFP